MKRTKYIIKPTDNFIGIQKNLFLLGCRWSWGPDQDVIMIHPQYIYVDKNLYISHGECKEVFDKYISYEHKPISYIFEKVKELRTPMLYDSCRDDMELCISLLKENHVDGETMQYILERVGQDDQMHSQLIMSKPIKDTLEVLLEKVEVQF